MISHFQASQRLRPALFLLLLLLPGLALATSATKAVAADDPATAEEVLERWLGILNDTELSDDALRSYVEGAFSEEFLNQVPVEQAVAVHQQIRSLAPIALHSTTPQGEGALTAILQAQGAWLQTQLTADPATGQITGLLVQPTTAPEDDGEENAQLDWSTLDELAAALAAEGDLPGVAIAWASLGGEPQVGVAGVRALGSDAAVEPNDRFHVGSITKSMTSTALGALVEAGKISWDAKLGDLLEGVDMNAIYADMTLGQVVRHRARIPQHLTFNDEEMGRLNGLPGTTTEQRATYVREVLRLEPIEDQFNYSNAGYAIAGHVAELVAEPWEEMMTKRVFEPLGLSTCGIGWPATRERPDEPRGHTPGPEGLRPQSFDGFKMGAFLRPAGDVHCSVGDLTRYGLAHLKGLGGDDGFLRAATIAELHRTSDAPYGAGWGVDPESGQHRHNGSAGTFFSYLTIDPEAKIVVAFLTNTGPPQGQPAAQRAAAEILGRFAK